MTEIPNFLIVGAAKSGTSTLHAHLDQHPDVCMCSIKEPHYFSYGMDATARESNGRSPVHHSVTSRQAYLKLFAHHGKASRIGESSVSYLYVPGTAERILEFDPRMKLIVTLRNPMERAYSSFYYAKSYGIEPSATLLEGLAAEPDRIRKNSPLLLRYRDLGLYASQLDRYYRVFSRDQIKVILYDDFIQDTVGVVRELFEFLGVRSDVQPNPRLHMNGTRTPDDNNPLHRLMNGEHAARALVRKILPMAVRQRLRVAVRNTLFKPPPKMSGELRCELRDLFREDMEQLQELLDRDLSAWLN